MNVLTCATRGNRPTETPPRLEDEVCAVVATPFSECCGPYETHLLPDTAPMEGLV
ncbi:hypothetical protein [Streptomyces sp. NPDC001536]|uniref:hypothetical protein n=1 Tax=Streptomyces sp. NPDC001536 TaxID=3364583 RepID=UPI0036B238DE